MLPSDGSWRVKNDQKASLKYLKDRICEIKQCLNYMLMIINQNILAILRKFLNLQKEYEKFYTNETIFKAATSEFFSKMSNRKKIYNE